MKVFVTGATGFIGKSVIGRLSRDKDYELAVLSRDKKGGRLLEENTNLIFGDLRNIDNWADKLRSFQPDAAIHMAWEGIPNYGCRTSLNNLNYGVNLFYLLRDVGCRKVISTGSCWEYGRDFGPLNENMQTIPKNPFTAAKNTLNIMGNNIFKESPITFIWTRLFYVYGSRQKESSFIPMIIKFMNSGKKPDIKTPKAKNDFVYVEDVAKAINELLLKCEESGIYNIGSGRSICVEDVVNLISAKKGIEKILYSEDNAKGIVDFWADISKIQGKTGWVPETNIEEGLDKCLKDLST